MDDFKVAARAVGHFLHCKKDQKDSSTHTNAQRAGDTLTAYVGTHRESAHRVMELGDFFGTRSADVKSIDKFPAMRYYAAVAFTTHVHPEPAQKAVRKWKEMFAGWVENGHSEAAAKHAADMLRKNPSPKNAEMVTEAALSVSDRMGPWNAWGTAQKRGAFAMTIHEAIPENCSKQRESLVAEASAALEEMNERRTAMPRLNIYGAAPDGADSTAMAKAQCKVAKFVAVNTPVTSKLHQQAAQHWDAAREVLAANPPKAEDVDFTVLKLSRAYSVARSSLPEEAPYRRSNFCDVVAKHLGRAFDTLAGIDRDVALDTATTAFSTLSARTRPQVVQEAAGLKVRFI